MLLLLHVNLKLIHAVLQLCDPLVFHAHRCIVPFQFGSGGFELHNYTHRVLSSTYVLRTSPTKKYILEACGHWEILSKSPAFISALCRALVIAALPNEAPRPPKDNSGSFKMMKLSPPWSFYSVLSSGNQTWQSEILYKQRF